MGTSKQIIREGSTLATGSGMISDLPTQNSGEFQYQFRQNKQHCDVINPETYMYGYRVCVWGHLCRQNLTCMCI